MTGTLQTVVRALEVDGAALMRAVLRVGLVAAVARADENGEVAVGWVTERHRVAEHEQFRALNLPLQVLPTGGEHRRGSDSRRRKSRAPAEGAAREPRGLGFRVFSAPRFVAVSHLFALPPCASVQQAGRSSSPTVNEAYLIHNLLRPQPLLTVELLP